VISIGRDLLRGAVPDANGPAIAASLVRHGADVRRITVVDDDREAVAAAVREALDRNPHLLITSGGLGPASDDVTLEGVAETLGRPLRMDHQARTMVETAYRRLAASKLVASAGLTVDREKPCMLPVGAIPVKNSVGVAPGVLCRLTGGAVVLCLPGRPDEMKVVLKAALDLAKDLLPELCVAQRKIEAPSPDEAEVRRILDKLKREYPTMWITSRPSSSRKKSGRAVIVLEATAPTREEAEAQIGAAQHRLFALATGAF
jgi:molybdenum cofactor synthesis domain-containing protein